MRIGIDVGGTKIAGVCVASDGAVGAELRRPAAADYPGTLETIARVVQTLDPRGDHRVGVATPGCLSPDSGVMINAKNTPLQGHAFDVDLSARIGRPVRTANDANCFALSEAVDGAGAGAEIVVGVILGTGVGAGIVIGGRILAGTGGTAGEWGHNSLPWPTAAELETAPPCGCGKRGCIEAWLSGPALRADHRRRGGDDVDPPEIARRAVADDQVARAALAAYTDRLARALASVINVLDPAVIVLGGGASNLPGLADSVSAQLGPWVFSDRVRARVVVNQHGDASGVRGAAWLWPAGEPGA